MIKKISVLLSICFLTTVFTFSQISLPKLISDGAVLQRDTELKIWGWAAADEQIEITFNNESFKTVADDKGNWHIILPPQEAGGPYSMKFQASNQIILDDILFGDLWLCSGQSNMELTMDRLKDTYPEIIRMSENSNIRQFLVPDKYDFNTEHTDFESGSWKKANPENLLEFSGVAYFFAKDLHEKFQVPIGIINAALGGSPIESWMSEEALKQFPYSYQELQRFKDAGTIQEIERKDSERNQSWYNELNTKDMGLTEDSQWYLEGSDNSDWEDFDLPGFWADQGLGNINGVVWFRKKIIVPESMTGKVAKLWLGRIVDQDHVYVNGEFVGSTGYQYPPRKYDLQKQVLKPGENTITIRVISEQGKGGFVPDKPYFLAVENDTIDLEGKWKYNLGTVMEKLEGPTFIRWKPGGLYNSMISPLVNYSIKGVIWYQGESNTGDPGSYNSTFPALINNWRTKWGIGDFPFLYVQLANFMEEKENPTESNWAELRQAQLNTLAVDNTGMAVCIDLGVWNDIHPLNKADVGKRLAQQAFNLAYEEDEVFSSPIPKNHKFYKNKVIVSFKNAESGLISPGDIPLKYFELSNDGSTFFKAEAKIKKDKVIVWNKNVSNPVALRYAWADNPQSANLYSKNGLPASPFQIKKDK